MTRCKHKWEWVEHPNAWGHWERYWKCLNCGKIKKGDRHIRP